MKTFLLIFQIVVAVLLILAILSQEKGAGLSGTFGGTGQVFRGRRGIDRVLMWVTTTLAILFVASSLAFLFLPPELPPADNGGLEITPVDEAGASIDPGAIEFETVPADSGAEGGASQ